MARATKNVSKIRENFSITLDHRFVFAQLNLSPRYFSKQAIVSIFNGILNKTYKLCAIKCLHIF